MGLCHVLPSFNSDIMFWLVLYTTFTYIIAHYGTLLPGLHWSVCTVYCCRDNCSSLPMSASIVMKGFLWDIFSAKALLCTLCVNMVPELAAMYQFVFASADFSLFVLKVPFSDKLNHVAM